MRLSLLIFVILLLSGCTTLSLTKHSCEEPILSSAICSVGVNKVSDSRAAVHVTYVHTGDYGKMVRVSIQGIGEGRDDVIGSKSNYYANPGRHTMIIPIGFKRRSLDRNLVYSTSKIRVLFRWIDEPVNAYGGILMRREVSFPSKWMQNP